MMRGANRRHQSRAAPALLRSGDLSLVAPPVPIPNTEVKRCSPDGSTAIGRARVGRRQNKDPGEFIIGVFAFGVGYSSRKQGEFGSGRLDDDRTNPRVDNEIARSKNTIQQRREG